MPEDSEIADWLASVRMLEREPALICAGRAARNWMNLPGVKDRNPEAFSSRHAYGARKAPAGGSPCPSGRRRKPIITGWSCILASNGWRIISIA